MNTYVLLLSEILLSLLASLFVLALLSAPLLKLLRLLCPHEEAAQFWLSYSKVMLLMGPLLLVLLMHGFSLSREPLEAMRLALIAVLVALLVGMRVLGKLLVGRIVPGNEYKDVQ